MIVPVDVSVNDASVGNGPVGGGAGPPHPKGEGGGVAAGGRGGGRLHSVRAHHRSSLHGATSLLYTLFNKQ